MRVANWQAVFAAEIQAAAHRKFRWGTWDCCQWGARMRRALTGIDSRELFPRYRNRREALVILAECGGMLELVRRALGEPIAAAFAQMGDLVLADFGHGLQPGICAGVWSLAPGRVGLERRLTDTAVAAWRI